jgi:hypothetical protein
MQPEIVEALAAEVALSIKRALAPLLERLAVAEVTLARLPAHEQTLGEVRDRVLVVETKAAIVPTPLEAVAIDLTPVLERVAAAEARLQTLGDLRDKVVTLETKAATPLDLGDLRDRLLALETRTAAELEAVRKELEAVDKYAARVEGYTSFLQRDASALGERVAVVETRAPVPGPAGTDGVNGKDGADGLSFGDLSLLQEDERTVVLRATRGEGVKELGRLTFPLELYRGVYLEGKAYERGDAVTWAGSEWHCNEPTSTKPGDGLKAWTLKVKRGRDGRDGKDAPGALPVVSIGGGR